MTTILQCSDAHADWVTHGVYRYEEVGLAMAQTAVVALKEKVDLYCFTGDLCDPDDGPRALRAVALAVKIATRLADEGIPSWWIRGNHDVFEDGSDESTLSALESVCQSGMVRVFDRPARAILPGKPKVSAGAPAFAVLLPYPSATRPYHPAEYLKAQRRVLSPSAKVFVAGHLQVEGATPGDESTLMARGRDVFFPFAECEPNWLCVNGHYHQGQTFTRPNRDGHDIQLHVPGSLVRLNHGEETTEPRFLIWEV